MIPVTIVLVLVTALITHLALNNRLLFSRYSFRPVRIMAHNEWVRMLSAGFLHVDWMHSIMNMIGLYSFASAIERRYGGMTLLIVYLGSIIGGNLLALYLHRKQEYTAVGASGGVCGLIFATLFLLPGTEVMLFLIPVGIPAWLFAVGFLLISYFGIRSQAGNIGHDAHFGGAIAGLLIALVMYPEIVLSQSYLLGLVLVVAIGLFVFLVNKPSWMRKLKPGRKDDRDDYGRYKPALRYQRYDEARSARKLKNEIDRILDKVSKTGLDSLSSSERQFLETYSKEKSG